MAGKPLEPDEDEELLEEEEWAAEADLEEVPPDSGLAISAGTMKR